LERIKGKQVYVQILYLEYSLRTETLVCNTGDFDMDKPRDSDHFLTHFIFKVLEVTGDLAWWLRLRPRPGTLAFAGTGMDQRLRPSSWCSFLFKVMEGTEDSSLETKSLAFLIYLRFA
jgi:hypothetical protein